MNKEKITEQIKRIIWDCEKVTESQSLIESTQEKIVDLINKVSKSHCGSWLGYHSKIYYRDFRSVPAGHTFSIEWGLNEAYSNDTTGDWIEYSYDDVKNSIFSNIDKNDELKLIEVSKIAEESAHTIKLEFSAFLDVLDESGKSSFFKNAKKDLEKINVQETESAFAESLSPRRQYRSRDSLAMTEGILVPPHTQIQCWLLALTNSFRTAKEMHSIAKKSLTFMNLNDLINVNKEKNTGKIFIGHGQSTLWRELKDFLKDRLHLDWEEFNRVAVAGKTTIERLSEVLENTSFAFLIMTGEDEHVNNTLHARENVIHEVGLFQGKLGFRRAIILLEEGCAEYSNIFGLNQIRFPKGNIQAKFEEIRLVLEREGLTGNNNVD